MDDRDQLRLERFERVQTFNTENHDDWPADSLAAQDFAEIDDVITGLGGAKVNQIRTPVSKQTVLDSLWLDSKAIARTARSIDQKEPGFSGDYQVPASRTETSTKTHVDALLKRLEDNDKPVAEGGDTPAQKAAKAALRAKFIAYFLPADFVEDLRTNRDALDGKNHDKRADNAEGLAATGDLEPLFEKGNNAVARLNAALQNLYARNPGKLHAWLTISRVERAPKKKKPDAEGPTDSGTPPPPAKP